MVNYQSLIREEKKMGREREKIDIDRSGCAVSAKLDNQLC